MIFALKWDEATFEKCIYLYICLFHRDSAQLLLCTRVGYQLIYICSPWSEDRESISVEKEQNRVKKMNTEHL